MRKIRNPRYAPEFLERKLSPSAMGAAPPAEVQVLTEAVEDPIYPVDPDVPVDPTDPSTPPSDPGGPSEPY